MDDPGTRPTTLADHMLARAHRHVHGEAPTNAVEALASGASREAVVASTGLTAAAVDGVRSFYSLLATPAPTICTGTACRFAEGGATTREHDRGVHCLGRCYAAPATVHQAAPPIPRASLVDAPQVFRNVLGARMTLERIYAPLPAPEQILALIEATGLRGRGGAAYPTAAKWRAARATPADRRYVVANGDEGDPGSYVDRLLLEDDPHDVLAGMRACATAIGATHGIVYVRGEYPVAAERVRAAIAEARAGGWLGEAAGFDVVVHTGAGSYVCGEETALLRGIEGLRAEPSPKPPYPAQAGLHGFPTVVQNVETLATIPWVLATGRKPTTKAVSLAGALAHPQAVEVELGTPIAEILARGGGGARAGTRPKLALVGGPMGRVVPANAFDTPLGFDTLPGMGHAGIVVIDESVEVRALAEHLFDFAASESCGSCTPCRVGTSRLATIRERASFERLLDTLELGSLCGFGQGVPRPLRDLLQHFGGELGLS